jgi:pyruvate dehydrogenase E2 component (dihydrolipoamide acetyltransferase)
MSDFCMPSLGADMESGTIVEWRVAPGDAVTRGQIVAEVETEKANIEIEIFQTGRIGELLVPVGVEVNVGTPLATVLSLDGEPGPAAEIRTPPPPTMPSSAPAEPAPLSHGRVTSPLVRRLAKTLLVDLDTVEPTGPGSAITRADVERAAASGRNPTEAPAFVASRPRVSPRARKRAAELGIDLTAITPPHPGAPITAGDLPAAAAPASTATAPATHRGLSPAVGRLMERSKREIPHYYVSDDIDMTTSLDWLERTNADRSVQERLLPAALMLRAVVIAAQEAGEMNGHFVDGSFAASDAVHLGVAVSLRNGGLIAPVIRDAHTLDLSSLMAALREIVARTRTGTLRGTDVEAATITVTNLGERGASAVFGVIIPPQVAIVGFGRISERPWAAGGMVGARPVVTASLSADHRVSHGHSGARLLSIVARSLSKPEEL